jgi:hypothetical protein
MRAAHIFPYQHGQYIMNEIFAGESSEEGGLNELFSPRNGMMLSSVAEERFDKFLFVIVPLVDDDNDPRQIQAWHASGVKRYRIRVVEKKDSSMTVRYSEGHTRTWAELDGREVAFRTSARPRARYLYYHYCIAMLRRAWHRSGHATTVLRDELGRKFWGTPGPYLRKKCLLAFVGEIGNDEFLEGALPERPDTSKGPGESNDDELKDLTLLSASAAITLGDTPETEAEGIRTDAEESELDDEDESDQYE